jgi:hypothetical protein
MECGSAEGLTAAPAGFSSATFLHSRAVVADQAAQETLGRPFPIRTCGAAQRFPTASFAFRTTQRGVSLGATLSGDGKGLWGVPKTLRKRGLRNPITALSGLPKNRCSKYTDFRNILEPLGPARLGARHQRSSIEPSWVFRDIG